jgi:hypothetical protein
MLRLAVDLINSHLLNEAIGAVIAAVQQEKPRNSQGIGKGL